MVSSAISESVKSLLRAKTTAHTTDESYREAKEQAGSMSVQLRAFSIADETRGAGMDEWWRMDALRAKEAIDRGAVHRAARVRALSGLGLDKIDAGAAKEIVAAHRRRLYETHHVLLQGGGIETVMGYLRFALKRMASHVGSDDTSAVRGESTQVAAEERGHALAQDNESHALELNIERMQERLMSVHRAEHERARLKRSGYTGGAKAEFRHEALAKRALEAKLAAMERARKYPRRQDEQGGENEREDGSRGGAHKLTCAFSCDMSQDLRSETGSQHPFVLDRSRMLLFDQKIEALGQWEAGFMPVFAAALHVIFAALQYGTRDQRDQTAALLATRRNLSTLIELASCCDLAWTSHHIGAKAMAVIERVLRHQMFGGNANASVAATATVTTAMHEHAAPNGTNRSQTRRKFSSAPLGSAALLCVAQRGVGLAFFALRRKVTRGASLTREARLLLLHTVSVAGFSLNCVRNLRVVRAVEHGDMGGDRVRLQEADLIGRERRRVVFLSCIEYTLSSLFGSEKTAWFTSLLVETLMESRRVVRTC